MMSSSSSSSAFVAVPALVLSSHHDQQAAVHAEAADPHYPRDVIMEHIGQRVTSVDSLTNLDSIEGERSPLSLPPLPPQTIEALVVDRRETGSSSLPMIPQFAFPATFPVSAHAPTSTSSSSSSLSSVAMSESTSASSSSSSSSPLPMNPETSAKLNRKRKGVFNAEQQVESLFKKRLKLMNSKVGYIHLILAEFERCRIISSSEYRETLRLWLDSLSRRHLYLIAFELRVFGNFILEVKKDTRFRIRKKELGRSLVMLKMNDTHSHSLRPFTSLIQLLVKAIRDSGFHKLLNATVRKYPDLKCVHDQFGLENAADSSFYSEHTGLYHLYTRFLLPIVLLETVLELKNGEKPHKPQSVAYLQKCFKDQPAYQLLKTQNQHWNLVFLLEIWCKMTASDETSSISVAAASSSSASSSTPPASSFIAPIVDIVTLRQKMLKDGMSVPHELTDVNMDPSEFITQFLFANMMVDHEDRMRFGRWMDDALALSSLQATDGMSYAPVAVLTPPPISEPTKRQRTGESPPSAVSSNWTPGAPAASSSSSAALHQLNDSHSVASHNSHFESPDHSDATMALINDNQAFPQAHPSHLPQSFPYTNSSPSLESPELIMYVPQTYSSANLPTSPLPSWYIDVETSGRSFVPLSSPLASSSSGSLSRDELGHEQHY